MKRIRTAEAQPIKSTKQLALEIVTRMYEITNLYCEDGMNDLIVHDMVANVAGGAAALEEFDTLSEQPGKHDEEVKIRMELAQKYLDLLENNEQARQQELTTGSAIGWKIVQEAKKSSKSHHTEYIKAVLKQFDYL